MAKTGDLFKFVHLRTPFGTDIWWLPTKAGTVGEWEVCNILECFLLLHSPITTRQQSCGKVMFSKVFVCLPGGDRPPVERPQWYWHQVAAIKAGSMHPTGMHSCCACYVFDNRITMKNVDKLIKILNLIRLTDQKDLKRKNSQCLKLPMS